jgi:transcription-repair coupling factor (superfamily II helicase)
MKDLEIRGAGNLLGAEQSGHIAAVGFELYCQLLKEAIEEKRGKARERKVKSPLIDLPVDTFIPQDYIESPQVRLEMYRKVARIEKEEEIAGLAAQFQDRFGPIPLSLQYLLDIFRIKLLAWDLGVPSIKESKGVVQVLLPGVEKMSLKMMQELFEASRVACHFHRSVLTLEDLLGRRKKMLAPDGDFDPPRLWIGKLEKILRRLMEWKGQGKI